MQRESQEIKVIRVREGWVWTLLDVDGALVAAGTAPAQAAAMELAWRAARALKRTPCNAYPEIVVEVEPPLVPGDSGRGG